MKEAINKRLKEHICTIMLKEQITTEDAIFLYFMHERIEAKEKEKAMAEEQARRDAQWRESLMNMMKGAISNG